MKLVGIDVGGTFTDIILTDSQDGTTYIHKVPSTPDDPSQAVVRGVEEVCLRNGIALGDISHVFHGTTVATNAALQYRGASCGMITTRGFRDVLHIGRHQRPQHYSIRQDIPWQARPLIHRRYRKVVTERIAPPDGEVVTPLDEHEVRTAAMELHAANVEAIAICFLFAHLNPRHENRAKAIVSEICPDTFVTTSHEVSLQYREFERFTTTAMNAFIGPLVRGYVSRLERALRDLGVRAELHIMCSNGGVATAESIAAVPVKTLLSGLAGGLLGAAWCGTQVERRNVIGLDIGGTSADIGVITGGEFREAAARDTFVAGYPIISPMLDLHTIGAGGGSIAMLTEAGSFSVGPRSAGAVPGPAAYGRGGREATVTDANLVLGRLDSEQFLGGAMALDVSAAVDAVDRLADRVGMSRLEMAEGIIAVVNSNMANAIRMRTVQRGIDPRRYSLVVAGGAGPLHGAEIASQLGIAEVIVPSYPGIHSALGLLTSDLKYEKVRSTLQRYDDLHEDVVLRMVEEMQHELTAQLLRDGFDRAAILFVHACDARYCGQGYELRVRLPSGDFSRTGLTHLVTEFHARHQEEYGHNFPGNPVEIVNLYVAAIGPMPKIVRVPAPAGGSRQAAPVKHQQSVFRIGGKLQKFELPLYRRADLAPDLTLKGPAILLQLDTTTVVPPGCRLHVHPTGNLLMHIPVL
ncbi:MAG: hydantoinase/oxoprolinase family protein [Steroidobacteraceae bacterium]